MQDLEFVQKCVKGKSGSWDEFLDKYSRLIYTYVHNVLDVRGRAFKETHIEDIFQEIIYSLIKDDFRKLRTFKAKNGCTLASWLRQVTINFSIDYLRKLKPDVSFEQENGDFSLKDILFDNSPFVSDILTEEEKLQVLSDCIQRLNDNDKYFVEMHIYRGVRLQELTGQLKLSRGAVDMQKSRIVGRLRDCFQEKGFIIPEG